MRIRHIDHFIIGFILTGFILSQPEAVRAASTPKDEIKAYCIDFNWEKFYGKPKLARPGAFANSDPAEHFKWYKMMGCNVIQTFCVSTVGYAWYKGGVVPEQPGLKHDYLREMVRLGHADGMRVFGYFTIGSNPRWAKLRPDQNYGGGEDGQISGGYHVVYTDDYLAFLTEAIQDAVGTTGIDGFMIDWLWQPNRKGKWIEAEKDLYAQLMQTPFPGEKHLTVREERAYSRKALERAWTAIRTAAKDTNPDCIIWLTVNKMDHPHVVDSTIYQEVDWLMNEAGDMERISHVKDMVGDHTHLITCMAAWTGVNATDVVPKALEAGIGLYGFNDPAGKNVESLAKLLAKPVSTLKGDAKNIATLARAYNGVPLDSIRNKDGNWVTPEPKTQRAGDEPKTDDSTSRPNIVIITADDMAWTDLSYIGNEYVNTPNLSKLADTGVLFPRGYVPTALSRASLMTLISGQYPHEHGITTDDEVIWRGSSMNKPAPVSTIKKIDTLPRLLAKKGYLSFQCGRWFEGRFSDAGFTHGTAAALDHAYAKPAADPDLLKACEEFMDLAQTQEKPFLLWYAPALPAFNFHVRSNDAEREALLADISQNQTFSLNYGLSEYYFQFQKPMGRGDVLLYYALVELFDTYCGQLIDSLEKRGLRDNTLIIVQSANGWVTIRRRGSWAPRTKGSPYDGGVRSPMICSWPAKIKPDVSDTLVSSIDVVPTVLAAVDSPKPKKALPGVNLLPVLEGNNQNSDRAIFGEAYSLQGADIRNPQQSRLKRWVIDGSYKLVMNGDGKGSYVGGGSDLNGTERMKLEPELFDLIKDPYEQTNLYTHLPQVALELKQKLDEWDPYVE
jgi:arylsulfatase A-like enzyme